MRKKILLPLVSLFLICNSAFSQLSISDSSIVVPMIYATYSYQWPSGDLHKLFGGNSSIGGGFMVKTRSNWLIGAEGNYLFGGTVRISDSLLKNISTPEGLIINSAGNFEDIMYQERGFNVFLKFGKVIPVLAPNKNCGPTVIVGAGYLQDKIRIHGQDNAAPQIQGDYKKGYDRLNSGFELSASLGYTYLSDKRLINFYIGFEFMQAWTKFRRERNFDTGLQDNSSLSTQFYGFKLKWMIPLYKRKPNKVYLY
jgi:hypothetical protein